MKKYRVKISREVVSTQSFLVNAQTREEAEHIADRQARDPSNLHMWNYEYTDYELEEIQEVTGEESSPGTTS